MDLKDNLISIILFVGILFFCSINITHAMEKVKTCNYGEFQLGEFGYNYARANLYKDNDKYYIKDITVNEIFYPDIRGGYSFNFKYNVAQFNALDKSDIKNKSETFTIANSVYTKEKHARNRFYYVKDNQYSFYDFKVQPVEDILKEMNSGGDQIECPNYFVLVRNDVPFGWEGGVDNFRAYLINNESQEGEYIGVNDFQSIANQYPEYNYVMFSGHYETGGEMPDEDSSEEEKYDTCDGLLGTIDSNGEYKENTVGWLLQKVFDYMKIGVAVILFAKTIMEYASILIAQDDSKFKSTNIRLLKRIVFALIFFLLPELVNLIVSIVDSSTCGIK